MKFTLLLHRKSFIEVYFAVQEPGTITCGTKLWKGKKLAVSIGEDKETVLNKSLDRLFREEEIKE
ncbi:hypothetical protein [Peribacillus sp. SCS-37]|uniref:hypothetical protein n=1 Tax=Paraperibacillus esterisolvens TaxID=3115296 RepID=UPI003906CCAB